MKAKLRPVAIVCAMSMALQVLSAASASGANALARPNVVILLTDDQTLDMMRYMPITKTELIDHGVYFPNAIVPNSVCCPSRASILTGNYSSTTGVWDNSGSHGGFDAFTNAGNDQSTIATWLDGEGYETGLFGKYLNEYGDSTGGRFRPPGWDEWVAYTKIGYHNYSLANVDETGGSIETYSGPTSPYAPTLLAQRAADFIRATPASSPLFLYYAPFDPHKAHGLPKAIPADQDRGTFSDLPPLRLPSYNEKDVSDKPSWIRRDPQIDRRTGHELDRERISMIEALQAVDRAVGDLVTALRAEGRLDNTLIVFMSDNGYLFGQHRERGKNTPYDAATRVPMVIRYDPLVAASGVSGENAMNIDVAPTVADLAGVTPTPDTDGLSLRPMLLNPDGDIRGAFLLEGGDKRPSGHSAYCGARDERYMYVRYADGQAEFYDYEKDPFELNNSIDSHRRRVRRHIRELKSFARQGCAPAYPGYSWHKSRRGRA
jgi:N-acetylglucosamine-6-sulfatase